MSIPADADPADVVRHVFDHPYAEPAWHWPADADYSSRTVDDDVPLEIRRELIATIADVYRQVYAPRCHPCSAT